MFAFTKSPPDMVWWFGLWAIGLGSITGWPAEPGRAGPEQAPLAVSTPDPQLAPGRPRLFFGPDKVAALKKRVEDEAIVREAWQNLQRRAESLLRQEFVSRQYAESGQGQHGNYGRPSSQISQMAGILGLAYQVTGDPRYAEKLKAALLHYATLNRWAGDAGWDPPWHSELNTARFCFGYAVGYDSIHDYLSAEQRREVAGAMVRLGILPTLNDWVLPGQRIHALDSMGHNWWSVCVSMAGLAAVSLLGDEPQAVEWTRRVTEGFPEWFGYRGNILQNKSLNFDPGGAFYESVSYANYALSEYLLFRLACANVLPHAPAPSIPVLSKTGDFFVHTCYPTTEGLLSVNFGDSSLQANGARTVGLLLANGFEKPAYHWYLQRANEGLGDPIGLVCYPLNHSTATTAGLPTSVIYPDIGWAMMRSGWEDNATLLAVKSGFAWNHAHPDAGSFILLQGGKPLIIDSGTCSYSRPEYTRYYRRSRAHNVILHDGEAQNPEDIARGDRGVVTPGEVHYLLDAAGVKYVLADATGPTSWKFSRNYRHFLWLDRVILIVDDIRAHEPGRLEWLLHYEGTATPQGPNLLLANGDRCQALLRPLFPENMALAEKKGLRDHDPDTEVVYLAFSPKEPRREAKFITAILPGGSAEPAERPVLEKLQADDMLGVRIRDPQRVTDVYLNLRADGRKMHRNSCHVLEGWETDAYLLAISQPAAANPEPGGSPERLLVVCGSYLRRNGQVWLDSLSKVYAVFEPNQPVMEVALQGQRHLNVSLHSPRPRHSIRLNGQTTPVAYDKTSQLLRINL